MFWTVPKMKVLLLSGYDDGKELGLQAELQNWVFL